MKSQALNHAGFYQVISTRTAALVVYFASPRLLSFRCGIELLRPLRPTFRMKFVVVVFAVCLLKFATSFAKYDAALGDSGLACSVCEVQFKACLHAPTEWGTGALVKYLHERKKCEEAREVCKRKTNC